MEVKKEGKINGNCVVTEPSESYVAVQYSDFAIRFNQKIVVLRYGLLA